MKAKKKKMPMMKEEDMPMKGRGSMVTPPGGSMPMSTGKKKKRKGK